MKKSVKKTSTKKVTPKKNNGIMGSITHPNILPSSYGEKASDKLTQVAGSWGFILSFAAFLVLWVILNSSWLVFGKAWDAKPFILLNLILSCLAAFQAPIILMSQNRQADKDRQRAEYDYAVNRKAAREIDNLKKIIHRIDRRLSK